MEGRNSTEERNAAEQINERIMREERTILN
jgi:hypothetical protein